MALDPSKVAAIIPAAGLATRFGGPNKLLELWGDITIVGQVKRTLVDCGLAVVVVTGRDKELVADVVGPGHTVFNPNYKTGLGSSIAVGVKACPPFDAYLIALGDMPGLQPGVIQALLANFEGPADIVAPIYEDEPRRPGHPVLFGASYRAQLEHLSGDTGARQILMAHEARLKLVTVSGSLADIDEPESR